MIYFVYTAIALMIVSSVFSILAMANLSEYGSKNISHFVFRLSTLYGKEYFNTRGWMWRKMGIIFFGLAILVMLLSSFRGVLGFE
jgi:hypothetical protein